MKKLKRYVLLILLSIMLIFTYTTNVQAASMANLVEWNVVTSDGNTYTLKDNATQDIVVSSGETVVLDLGGYNLTNYTKGCSTITVEEGGTLTITGTGTISNTSTNNVPVVSNSGTLYVTGGTVESSNGSNSTGISNSGTLYFSAGEVKTVADNCWGLTNYGTATITGGTFTQGANYSVIMNAGNMTISGGTINVNSGYSAITNDAADDTASLTITDVTVTGASYIIANPSGEEVVITGGTYGTNTNITDYLGDTYTVDENGSVVEKEEPTTPETPVEDPTENPSEETPTEEETVDETTPETTDEEPTTPEENTTETVDNVTENPTTGDHVLVFGIVFVIAVVGLTVALVVRKRMK